MRWKWFYLIQGYYWHLHHYKRSSVTNNVKNNGFLNKLCDDCRILQTGWRGKHQFFLLMAGLVFFLCPFLPIYICLYMSFGRIHRFSRKKYSVRPHVRGSFMLPTAFQSLFTSKSPHGSPHSDRIPIRGWQPGRLFLTHFSCSGSDFLRNFVLSSRAAGAQRHESYRL